MVFFYCEAHKSCAFAICAPSSSAVVVGHDDVSVPVPTKKKLAENLGSDKGTTIGDFYSIHWGIGRQNRHIKKKNSYASTTEK